MGKTLSFHGGKWSYIGHNKRDGKESKDGHIDSSRTHKNITLIDRNIKAAYKEIFQPYVDEYNAKQKRSDRKIDDYYKKISHDKKKNTHYEYIFQIGNMHDKISEKDFCQIAKDYVDEFQIRNPNLIIVGAYIHLDEATPHMHMAYVPVAHYETGMKLQTSSNKAFEELTGYKSTHKRDTAQIKWQESEREYVKSLCMEYGIEITEGNSKGVKSLRLDEWQAKQDKERAEHDRDEIIQQTEKTKEESEKIITKYKEKVAAMEHELDDAETRFNFAKHNMNAEYKTKREKLDKIVKKFETQIKELHEMAEKYDLPVFDEKARKIEHRVKQIIESPER